MGCQNSKKTKIQYKIEGKDLKNKQEESISNGRTTRGSSKYMDDQENIKIEFSDCNLGKQQLGDNFQTEVQGRLVITQVALINNEKKQKVKEFEEDFYTPRFSNIATQYTSPAIQQLKGEYNLYVFQLIN